MRKEIFTFVLTVTAFTSQAQTTSLGFTDLSAKDLDQMAASFDRAPTEGAAWARVKAASEALYLELRAKGETSHQAMHNLRRIALPGLDIGELGQRGIEIRQRLSEITQHTKDKDGLSEPAAVAATALTMHDVLQSFVALEKASHVHMAIENADGFAQLRRSESLYEDGTPRVGVKFTERLSPTSGQSCTVDALKLAADVYFTVECRAKGKDTFPLATAKSECSINGDRMRALRLVLQPSQSEPATEVFVWCSFDPR